MDLGASGTSPRSLLESSGMATESFSMDCSAADTASTVESRASTDSGSLTQRAAMIRDELLGNDSVEQSSVHDSASSSADSGIMIDEVTQNEDNRVDEDDLENRLANSSIAHSLRHIAVAFDEKSRELESLRKIQQTHEEEMTSLRGQLETKTQEVQAASNQVAVLTSDNRTLEREVEALRLDNLHKDELLCFSDRISSRLFDLIHVIKAQVEAAESLSPAIRSHSTTSSPSSAQSEASFTDSSFSSSETTVSSTPDDASQVTKQAPVSAEQIVHEIRAKYADLSVV